MKKTKSTLILGALTSSFGIFISKILGLTYVIPLNSLAGSANISFYSIAYSAYGLILNICSAGIPFAVSSLVAKYVAKDDYQTAKLIKRIATIMVMTLSFVILLVFLSSCGFLAQYNLGSSASPADVSYLRNTYFCLTMAIVLVPLLAVTRGYYQGLKRMEVYAKSEVIEQFFRILCIILLGFVFVRILKFPSIFAIYMAVLAAGIGAVCSYVYIRYSTREINSEIDALAASGNGSESNKKAIIKEIINLGLPYIVASILGTTSSLINSNFYVNYATSVGLDYQESKLVLGIFQVNCNKLAAIPGVLTLGFSTGLVPYLSEDLYNEDYDSLRKHISEIFKTVTFFLLPMALAFFLFPKAMYYIMFGNNNLELGANLLKHTTILVLSDTISPILVSILVTLRMRREVVRNLILGTIAKAISFVILIKYMGYLGIIYSSFVSTITCIGLGIYTLTRHFKYDIKKDLPTLVKLILSSLTMVVVYFALNLLGLRFTYSSRLIDLILLAVYGSVSLLLYLLCTNYLQLIKEIFNTGLGELLLKIKNRIIK